MHSMGICGYLGVLTGMEIAVVISEGKSDCLFCWSQSDDPRQRQVSNYVSIQ